MTFMIIKFVWVRLVYLSFPSTFLCWNVVVCRKHSVPVLVTINRLTVRTVPVESTGYP